MTTMWIHRGLVLILVSIFCYEITKSFQRYLRGSFGKAVEMTHEDDLRNPAFTICPSIFAFPTQYQSLVHAYQSLPKVDDIILGLEESEEPT